MLSKCANPQCSASFRYLHDGKLFRMEVTANFAVVNDPAQNAKKPPLRTEFFWLCNTCSKQMTIIYNREVGVTTRPLPTFRASVGL
jgi:hypothetical protein